MPQDETQPVVCRPPAARAGTGGLRLGALALAAGLLVAAAASAEAAGQAANQASPPAGERAGTDAGGGVLEPAPVPDPPEQAPGQSFGDETLIELPIAPAGTRPDEAGAPDEAPAPAAAAPEEAAATAGAAAELRGLRVLFAEGGIAIDGDAESELAGLAGYLSANQTQRVVLHAYAAGNDQGRSDARRLSLSRALAIRSFLVDRGVPVERIYLRPLGSEVQDGPPDRVDILPLRP